MKTTFVCLACYAMAEKRYSLPCHAEHHMHVIECDAASVKLEKGRVVDVQQASSLVFGPVIAARVKPRG